MRALSLAVVVALLAPACNPFALPARSAIPLPSGQQARSSVPPLADAPLQAALPSHPAWPAPVPIAEEASEPLPEDPSSEPRYAPPADKPLTRRIGPFEISTYNPVTITAIETHTHVYFTARNTSSRPARIASSFSAKDFSSGSVSVGKRPADWIVLHAVGFDPSEPDFFHRFDLLAKTVAPGRTFTFDYIVGTGLREERAEADVPVYFQLTEGGRKVAISLHLIGASFQNELARVPTNAAIAGRVTDPHGRPVSGADITLGLWNAEQHLSATSDSDGRYMINVPSQGELKSIVGNRPLPWRSLGYFVTAEAPGYELGYAEEVRAAGGATTTLDFTLSLAPRPSYRKIAEFKSDGRYAYWYLHLVGPKLDRVVATQGQHLPRAPGNPPGHLVALRLSDGKQLWRFPTPDGCENVAVSPDQTRIAVGCWDGFMYVLDYEGHLLWKRNVSRINVGNADPRAPADNNRPAGEPRYSPDGKWLAGDRGSGPFGPFFTLYDARARSARIAASAPERVSARVVRFRWAPDGKSVYAFGNNDDISRYDLKGRRLWTRWAGLVPLWAEVDPAGNVYLAGKGSALVSYDPTGRLRFHRMLAQTSDEATHGISADGRFLVVPTFNGLLDAFDSQGDLYFQRWLPGAASDGGPEGPGHNALDITPDGRYFLVGTRSNRLHLFDAHGTLLWSDQAVERTDFRFPENKGIDFFPGADSVAITADARYLVAGYADSTIRIFERE
jgi:outer membrane protein assembly factor BamB